MASARRASDSATCGLRPKDLLSGHKDRCIEPAITLAGAFVALGYQTRKLIKVCSGAVVWRSGEYPYGFLNFLNDEFDLVTASGMHIGPDIVGISVVTIAKVADAIGVWYQRLLKLAKQ